MKLSIFFSATLFLAFAAFSVPLVAEPAAVTTQPAHEGIVAIVDQDVVTQMDVERNFADTKKLLIQNLQGEALVAMIRKGRLGVINALVDRLVILHAFSRQGNVLPPAFVDARINDEITQKYAGDKKLFEEVLADRGVTLDEFGKEISDNAIIEYMRSKNVTSKVDALQPPDKSGEMNYKIQRQWLDSLRTQSYVKIFETQR